MSESTEVVTSKVLMANPTNLIIIAVSIIAIIITLSICIILVMKKSNIKKISKDGVEINSDQVRIIENNAVTNIHEIMRKQLSYIDCHLKCLRNKINHYIEELGYRYSDFPVPLVIELIKDEVIEWMIFNSIEDTQVYISIHRDKLWEVYSNAVWSASRGLDNVPIKFKGEYIERKLCTINFESEYFQNLCNNLTQELVTSLVRIKILNSRKPVVSDSKEKLKEL